MEHKENSKITFANAILQVIYTKGLINENELRQMREHCEKKLQKAA